MQHRRHHGNAPAAGNGILIGLGDVCLVGFRHRSIVGPLAEADIIPLSVLVIHIIFRHAAKAHTQDIRISLHGFLQGSNQGSKVCRFRYHSGGLYHALSDSASGQSLRNTDILADKLLYLTAGALVDLF